jgi:hypothetical protein
LLDSRVVAGMGFGLIWSLLALLAVGAGSEVAFRLAVWGALFVVFLQFIGILILAGSVSWLWAGVFVFHAVFVGMPSAFFWLNGPQVVTSGEASIYATVAALAGQVSIGFVVFVARPVRFGHVLPAGALSFLIAVVAGASLLKITLYQESVQALGGHMAIYTDGGEIRGGVSPIVRYVAAGLPFFAVLVFTQKRFPLWVCLTVVAVVLAEFVIGIRGRPLYVAAASLAVYQVWLTHRLAGRFVPLALFGIAVPLTLIVGVSREGLDVSFLDYSLLMFESVGSTFGGAVTVGSFVADGSLVLRQVAALLFPTGLERIDTVSKLLTVTHFPDAYVLGYGVSSSALLEVLMLSPGVLSPFVYVLLMVGGVGFVSFLLGSRSLVLALAGVAMLPALFYVGRAELWQPVVWLAKSLPFVVMTWILCVSRDNGSGLWVARTVSRGRLDALRQG